MSLFQLGDFHLHSGIPFAQALGRWKRTTGPLLIAEDVVTTGESMSAIREQCDRADVIGVTVFCRGTCPDWVTPLFQMPTMSRTNS